MPQYEGNPTDATDLSGKDIETAKKIIDSTVSKEEANQLVISGLRMVADAIEHDQHAEARTGLSPHGSGDDHDYHKDYPNAKSLIRAQTASAPGAAWHAEDSYDFYHGSAKDRLPHEIRDALDEGKKVPGIDTQQLTKVNDESLNTTLNTVIDDNTSQYINIVNGVKTRVTIVRNKNGEDTGTESSRPATLRTHKAAQRLMAYKLRKEREKPSNNTTD